MSAPVRSYDPGNPRGGLQTPFFKIYIQHLPTQQKVDFGGWVTEFSDQFSSNWEQETVYGRMDPLVTFNNTGRQISIGFDVVSGDTGQAIANLAAMNRLTQFLYPVYNIEKHQKGDKKGTKISEPTGMGMQNTLKAAPLIGMRWTNLMANPLTGQQLIGFLDGFTYAPELQYGGFILGGSVEEPLSQRESEERESAGLSNGNFEDDITRSTQSYIPKVVSVSLNYTVIHTHLMGWHESENNSFVFADKDIDSKYPNAFMMKENATTPSSGENEDTSTQVIQSNQSEVLDG